MTPSFALSGLLAEPPTYDALSTEEIDALLVEMESDIRGADRDMREIDELEKKGVLGAGKLPGAFHLVYIRSARFYAYVLLIHSFFCLYSDYEKLDPRLQKVAKEYEEDVRLVASLESRIGSLMQRHASYVSTPLDFAEPNLTNPSLRSTLCQNCS